MLHFYLAEILTAVGPSDIFNLSGALPEQPQVSSSKMKMWLWSVALVGRFLTPMHSVTNLSYLTQSVVAQSEGLLQIKRLLSMMLTQYFYCHILFMNVFYMKLYFLPA